MKPSPGLYCAFLSLGSAGLALCRNFIMSILWSLMGLATKVFGIIVRLEAGPSD